MTPYEKRREVSVSKHHLCIFHAEATGRFGVAGLSYSNWVSDLLPLRCFRVIRPCVGSALRVCVCAADEITVFSYQNEMTKRGCVALCAKCLREGGCIGRVTVDKKENRNTVETLWTAGKQEEKWKDMWRFMCLRSVSRGQSVYKTNGDRVSLTHTHTHS